MYFENIDEMREFLVDECERRQEKVDKMGAEELLDELLQWYGICGWTSTILEWIEILYNCKFMAGKIMMKQNEEQ